MARPACVDHGTRPCERKACSVDCELKQAESDPKKEGLLIRNVSRSFFVAVTGLALAGYSTTPQRTQAVSEQHDADMIGNIEQLEGTWTMLDETGNETTATVYKRTAAGSAVQEVMFPGSPHEMVNLSHMDGSNLVVTHDCAAGNQPTTVAKSSSVDTSGARVYQFDLERVTNFHPDQEHRMGSLRLAINGDHLTQTWISLDENGHETEPVVFEMIRK